MREREQCLRILPKGKANYMNNDNHIHERVMSAIQRGTIQMRPRWYFILFGALSGLGALIALLALLYIASLALFLMHESGAWFAPSFGMRGWFSFFRAIPWLLIIAATLFIIILQILVRRYSFVWGKPLSYSLAIILVVVLFGGALLRPLHHVVAQFGRSGGPLEMVYRGAHQGPGDVFRGQIIATSTNAIVIFDQNGSGTTTLHINPRTRLPYGEDFEKGDILVVIGDTRAPGEVDAFGIREVSEEE